MSSRYKVRVAFLDVGQGDTTVISIPETEEAIVVDCIDANAVVTYLQNHSVKNLRGLIITHLHLDHYREAVEFLNNCERETGLICENVMFNWPVRRSKSHLFQVMLRDSDGHSDASSDSKINQNQLKTTYYELNQWVTKHRYRCGSLDIQGHKGLALSDSLDEIVQLIHPHFANLGNLLSLNDVSGVLKVQGTNSNAILMGDLEYPGWKILTENATDLSSDVLKFPHHGAWKKDDPNLLLDAISPSIIVISVGTNGIRYDHPNSRVFDAIAQHPDIHLMCTQVTKQCSAALKSRTESVKKHFKASDANSFFTRSGCPCAGSIILELGDNVEIIQPSPKFHQETIIKSHFDTHKCELSANL